jgi:hypothetical protein
MSEIVLFFGAGLLAPLAPGRASRMLSGTAPFPNPVTCTSTGAVTLSDNDIGTQPLKATGGYPTSFTIPSTVTGTISNIVVRLNGLTASTTGQGGADQGISSLGLLLVHGSSNLEILSKHGGLSGHLQTDRPQHNRYFHCQYQRTLHASWNL